ncbi:hypothetical protein AB4Z51_28240 [Bradyrhizobium sp. 2TAF36]|uniref:hypothetical protein n=1 Tax=Bradyrhizobium sp. 2TAF36 TaxID=3233016 RepID=UPI003F918E52
MTLTPKDWREFQHYKDRSPPWIKLHKKTLDNADFHRLPVASRTLAPMLWLLASEYDDGQITAELDDIAWRFRMSLEDLHAAVRPLIAKGLFISDDPASAPLAPRKPDAMPEREEEAEKEEETDSRPGKARPERAPSRFDEFWQAYPRRDGPNPRKPAETRFDSLVKTGLDPQMLIDAAKKLATDEGARGNIGTRFIPQAVTWLNQQRWSDHAAIAALQSMGPTNGFTIENAVEHWAKLGRWPRGMGAEPGMASCEASPGLLAQYGIAPDGRKLVMSLDDALE